jgi:hypothetical protein
MAFTLQDIVARKRALESAHAQAKAKLDAEYKPKIEILDNWLMKYLVDNKLKTVATEAGTVMTYARRKAKMFDFEAFSTWCEFNEHAEFIKHDVDSTEVLAYLDASAKNLLPDGLKLDSTDVLAVRAPK